MKKYRQKNAAAGMVFMIMFLVSAVLSVIYPGMFGAIGTAEVSAAGTVPEFTGWVQDDASLLSSEEEDALEKECARVSEVHGMGVYIVTTQDFGGGDIKNWQRQIFTEYGLGADCADSGVMLAISMAARDWGLVGFGEAQGAFTTYGRERMGELILDDLSDGIRGREALYRRSSLRRGVEDPAHYRGIFPVIAVGFAGYCADLEEEYEHACQKGRSAGVYAGRKFSAVESHGPVLISYGEQDQTPEGEQFGQRKRRDAFGPFRNQRKVLI